MLKLGDGELDLGEVLYDGFLGFALGGLGAGTQILNGNYRIKNEIQERANAQKTLAKTVAQKAKDPETVKAAEAMAQKLEDGEMLTTEEVETLDSALKAATQAEEAAETVQQEEAAPAEKKPLTPVEAIVRVAQGKVGNESGEQNIDTNDLETYNNSGRDVEVADIIERLNNGEATLDEVLSLPQIEAALRENREATPTYRLPNREAVQETAYRQAMAQGSFNGQDYSAPVKQERRMDIVIGLPGSGKSSVYTERISQEHGSRVIDIDDYRAYIPEYNGRNAQAVHEEASSIKKKVLAQALINGDNIILSTIGANVLGLEQDIGNYNKMGYTVHLHLNELPNNKSMARAVGRFLPEDGSQGRFVSPELIAEYGDKPTQTYLYLTRRSNRNGRQAEHNIASEARRTESVVESGHGGVAQTVREGRGADKRGDTGSVGELSSPTSEIASYDGQTRKHKQRCKTDDIQRQHFRRVKQHAICAWQAV